MSERRIEQMRETLLESLEALRTLIKDHPDTATAAAQAQAAVVTAMVKLEDL